MKTRIALLKMKSLLTLFSLAVCITPAMAKKFETPSPPPQYEYPFEGTYNLEYAHYDTSAHITVGGSTYSSYCSFGAGTVSCSDSLSSYSEVTLKPNLLKNPPAQAMDPRLANVPVTARCCVIAKELARRAEQQGYIAHNEIGKHFHYRVVESGNADWPLAFCVPPEKQEMVRVFTKLRKMSLTELDPDLGKCDKTPGGMFYTCKYRKGGQITYYSEACFYIK